MFPEALNNVKASVKVGSAVASDLSMFGSARVLIIPDNFCDRELIERATAAAAIASAPFPSAPFPTTWIEHARIGEEHHGWMINRDARRVYVCVIARGFCYFKLIRKGESFLEDSKRPDAWNVDASEHSNAMLNEVLEKLRHDCVWTNETLPGQGLKLRGANREHIRIKRIVRVVLKSERKRYEAQHGGPVQWSHRWEVAGHWRRIAEHSIGKSPDGDYDVRGMTWVESHEKGAPKDISDGVVRKTRIYTEARRDH